MTASDSPAPTTLKTISVRTFLLGQRIDTKNLEQGSVLATSPLTIRAGSRGRAVLFRYGVAILFDLDPLEEVDFLASLRRLVIEPVEPPETEEIRIHLHPEGEDRVEHSGAIILSDPTPERLQLLADILGKNAVLDHYEHRVAEVFDRIDPLAATLQRKGDFGSQGKELLQQIGGVLLTQQRMVGRVEVLDKPEVLWERPSLERFYLRLEDEYELRERGRVLDRKLDLIARTSETLLDLMQNRRSMRVEWYVVILIVIEIVLTIVSMTMPGHL
ncbi:RMD1 family protein [Telmatospirillum sp.]|uniref:RMD1 family protein n=1 Tax=Telmatospirillum sp. TaxID=2079197 RepID=UPI00283D8C71|nr:RMD1 family protein [Telmatospirillum sp.]MDR3438143.1 RMD1 family protein [Telmatospirillum sp.]